MRGAEEGRRCEQPGVFQKKPSFHIASASVSVYILEQAADPKILAPDELTGTLDQAMGESIIELVEASARAGIRGRSA